MLSIRLTSTLKGSPYTMLSCPHQATKSSTRRRWNKSTRSDYFFAKQRIYVFSFLRPANQDLLSQDGLDMEQLKNLQQRDFSLRGNYRKMLLKPRNISWRLERYDDNTIPLQPTDISLLKHVEPRNEKEGQSGTALACMALCLEFELPSSAYATMCIRELLKDSTEVAHHTALNSELAPKGSHGHSPARNQAA